MSGEVLTAVEGKAGRIRLNRPRALHALNEAMCATMLEAIEAWRGDAAVEIDIRGYETKVLDRRVETDTETGSLRLLWTAATRGRITEDGALRGEGVGADLLGHPFAALAWLASSACAETFGGLRAGQVVFLGSVTPPIWLDGPCAAVVEFDTLGRAEVAFG